MMPAQYDIRLPPRCTEISRLWRPGLYYSEFHVAVYSAYDISDEDMYHFIRDELSTSVDASRLLCRPPRWNWSHSRRLMDIVAYHTRLCIGVLNNLRDAEGSGRDVGQLVRRVVSTEIEGLSLRDPIYDPFSFFVLLEDPERTSNILCVTLNNDSGCCVPDCVEIEIAHAFEPIHAMQRGECTWTAIKNLLGYNEPPTDFDIDIASLNLLRLDSEGSLQWIQDNNLEEFIDPDGDDNDPEDLALSSPSPSTSSDEDEDMLNNITFHPTLAASAPPQTRDPKAPWTSYTFLLFHLSSSGLIRPLQRTWLSKWLNYMSSLCSDVRPLPAETPPDPSHPSNGVIEVPVVSTPSEHLRRDSSASLNIRAGTRVEDWTWEIVLKELPGVLADLLKESDEGVRKHLSKEWFLVWDHDEKGLLACRIQWPIEAESLERMSRRELKELGEGLTPNNVECVRMIVELDPVNWLREVANGMEILAEWETLKVPLEEGMKEIET